MAMVLLRLSKGFVHWKATFNIFFYSYNSMCFHEFWDTYPDLDIIFELFIYSAQADRTSCAAPGWQNMRNREVLDLRCALLSNN